MTYTADNIANIKRMGQLDSYIAHERKLIAEIEAGEIRRDEQGTDTVSFAHLYGRYHIDTDDMSVVAYVVAGSEWSHRWMLSGFDGDQSRGMAYARAALANQLKTDAATLASKARARLAELEAAQ